MDTLPEEILTLILLHCRQDMGIMSRICRRYNFLYTQIITDIKSGNITPDLWLGYINVNSFDVDKFKEPIDDFLEIDDNFPIKSWDINSTQQTTDNDHVWFNKLITAPLSQLYYILEPDNTSDYWIVVGKIVDTYVLFFASCSYTVYWPDDRNRYVTGGTFAYSNSWKQLWNMYLTTDNRNDLLEMTKYIRPELWYFYNNKVIDTEELSGALVPWLPGAW